VVGLTTFFFKAIFPFSPAYFTAPMKKAGLSRL
jgi:hypothetical protein